MNELLIGYARVSTNEQDLTAQKIALERLGVDPAYIYTEREPRPPDGLECARGLDELEYMY